MRIEFAATTKIKSDKGGCGNSPGGKKENGVSFSGYHRTTMVSGS